MHQLTDEEREEFEQMVQRVLERVHKHWPFPDLPEYRSTEPPIGRLDEQVVRSFRIMGLHGYGVYQWKLGKLCADDPHINCIPRETVEYFFGKWQERHIGTFYAKPDDWDNPIWGPVGPDRAKDDLLNWLDRYRAGLMWALVLDAEPELIAMLEWGIPTRKLDSMPGDWTVEDNFVWFVISAFLRGEGLNRYPDLRDKIAGSSRKNPKILLGVAEAIDAGNAGLVTKGIKELLKRHIRTVQTHPKQVSLDATILWHVARRRGMVLERPTDKEHGYLILTIPDAPSASK